MVSLKLNNLKEPSIKNAKQLPTFIKMVSPKLKNSEEPPVKDTKQLPIFSKIVLLDLLILNTIRTLKQYFKYN